MLTLNEKKYNYQNSKLIECVVKRCQIYLYGLKMTCLGVFRIEEIRDKNNETSLKEGERIEISNYSAFHIRDAPLSFA